jgi:membrane fusion protein (multidrug efflux system)
MARFNWQKLAVSWAVLLVLTQCGKGESDTGGGRRARSGRPGSGGAAAIPVRVESVTRGDITAFVETHARLEAERWVDILARTTGLVEQIAAEEGDRVVAGQVLARLDQEEMRLQVRQVEVALQQARSTFERTKELFDRQLVSEEEYDAAKHQVQDIEVGLEEAKFDLSHTTIRAPLAGLVMRRSTEVGRLIRVNDLVFSLADVDPLLARIHIPEKRMKQVRVGQRAQLSVDSFPDRIFEAAVRMINPGVDPQSGTVKVTLEVPPHGARLKPGMFASVRIITEQHDGALIVPKQALVLETDEDDLFVFADSVARRTTVKLGLIDGYRVEVLAGLTGTDRVITIGHEGLKDGSRVRLAGVQAASVADEAPEQRQGAPGAGQGGGQWSRGEQRDGGDGQGRRSMPDSATFIQRAQGRGMSEADAIARWQRMRERFGNRSADN